MLSTELNSAEITGSKRLAQEDGNDLLGIKEDAREQNDGE